MLKKIQYRDLNKRNLTFFIVKGYGDLIIFCSILNKLPEKYNKKISLVLGIHLKEFYEILNLNYSVVYYISQECDVPDLFNLRDKGLLKGIASAVDLASFLRKNISNNNLLVFDDLSWRERYIAVGIKASGLNPGLKNIYLSYADYLDSYYGIKILSKLHRQNYPPNITLGIFPKSRLLSKSFNSCLLKKLIFILNKLGISFRIFIMDGEDDGLEAIYKRYITEIPKSFEALRRAILSVDAVISADSMPAHFSYYLERPIFVISRNPNLYWLPLSSYNSGYWATFNDLDTVEARLLKFLGLNTG